ncbi:methyl-accepting chemotaxis protein [Pseudoalteromonas denitrificans]|uniref:Methyl-accepting chemotaxis protein n=1 Tax=Pseudoalteromonas denitrificans DSM 6059 TaxID=1123010 RepID=A0A1I1GX48_9GAMM|nr:methyl-accepting chemotaxis protein [Pseudoalteromonas denitrificans]SFC16111.1 methyl-accepting chemotaxis protein [Pseudoalteromonas denitrificans DSM 6059]
MKLKSKLIFQAIFLALVPALVTALIITLEANQASFKALENKTKERLVSLRELKKTQIESYFGTINSQIITMSKNPAVIDASIDFVKYFNDEPLDSFVSVSERNSLSRYYQSDFTEQFKSKNPNSLINANLKVAQLDNRSIHFQNKYIASNQFPLGQKDRLHSGGSSKYDETHERYHAMFQDFLTRFGYYDIFIADAKTGNIVYSVYKEIDYATSVKHGAYSNSGIGDAFRQSVNAYDVNHTSMIDFKSYFPSYNFPASFISSPIKNNIGETVAVLIYQMPIDGINNTMTSDQKWQHVGLGLSGETYLVGPDKLLRSESRFLIEDKSNYIKALEISEHQPNTNRININNSAIGLQYVDTKGVSQALQGIADVDVFLDYRDVPVLSAYTSISFGGLKWALMAEIDVAEAFYDAYKLSDDLFFYSILCLIVIAIFSIIIGLYITKVLVSPINVLVERITDISQGDGDLTAKLSIAERKDEIGDVAKAFNQFVLHIRNLIIDIDKHAGQLASASEELSSVTKETNEVVTLQKEKADQASIAMQNFTGNISEMSGNTEQSASLTQRANQESINGAEVALNTQEEINHLVQSVTLASNELKELEIQVQDITSILSVIDSIADQTNLLALNAAIEAARAGDSGRGFAVVADEVRMLAGKTQQSTVEIQNKIESLKISSNKSVIAMERASKQAITGITLVEETTTSLHLVTELISDVSNQNTENAIVATQQNENVDEVNQNIIDISRYTENTAGASLQTAQASNELAKLAIDMSTIVKQFKY